jgi:flagellar basal body-associated protein FliL
MSSAEAEEAPAGNAPPKKSKMGIVLAVVAVVLLIAGAAVAGTLLGPQLLSHGKKSEAGHEKSEEAHGEKAEGSEKVGETTELNAILVDTRSAEGDLHHLKVVLAVELDEATPKAEFMKYAPRGREVAVAYLRSQPFEALAAPERYDAVRKELSQRFTAAIAPARVGRVLVVDFVAQ